MKKEVFDTVREFVYEETDDGFFVCAGVGPLRVLAIPRGEFLFRQIRDGARAHVVAFGWKDESTLRARSLPHAVPVETATELQKDFLRPRLAAMTDGTIIFW